MLLVDCVTLVKSDLYRYTGRLGITLFIKVFLSNRFFRYQFYLRMSKLNLLGPFFCLLKSFSSVITGNQISKHVDIGPGLWMPHGYVVINSSTIIGSNFTILQFSTIGAVYGMAAKIGNSVYIGPNVSVVEDVLVGDRVIIGAGSVVVKDIPSQIVAVGVPAKPIHCSESIIADFIKNEWDVSFHQVK